jgi:hypothetical protein
MGRLLALVSAAAIAFGDARTAVGQTRSSGGATAGNTAQPGSAARAPRGLSWDSPRVRELQAELGKVKYKEDLKGPMEQELVALLGMLKQRFSVDEMHELAASFDSLPPDSLRWDKFQTYLVWTAMGRFLESGDRKGLVLLLSVRCPRYVAWHEVEYYLMLFKERREFADPISALGEAYGASKVPETRREIAAALRRAFTASGIRAADDGAFVTRATRWYEANKAHLALNRHYRQRSVTHGDPDVDALFIESPPEPGRAKDEDRGAQKGGGKRDRSD